MIRIARRLVPWILLIALPACGTDTGLGPGPSGTGDNQTPSAGEQALEAWLATGAYQRWACEPGPQDVTPTAPTVATACAPTA